MSRSRRHVGVSSGGFAPRRSERIRRRRCRLLSRRRRRGADARCFPAPRAAEFAQRAASYMARRSRVAEWLREQFHPVRGIDGDARSRGAHRLFDNRAIGNFPAGCSTIRSTDDFEVGRKVLLVADQFSTPRVGDFGATGGSVRSRGHRGSAALPASFRRCGSAASTTSTAAQQNAHARLRWTMRRTAAMRESAVPSMRAGLAGRTTHRQKALSRRMPSSWRRRFAQSPTRGWRRHGKTTPPITEADVVLLSPTRGCRHLLASISAIPGNACARAYPHAAELGRAPRLGRN